MLRGDWGFDGVVVTDWGAMNNRIAGFRAGCDLCMPGGSAYMEAETVEAIEKGQLSERDIDMSVARILSLVESKRAVFENSTPKTERELKAFEKIELKAGESKRVTFELDDRGFSIWQNGWVVPGGEYKICVGASCEDIRLEHMIRKDGANINYAGLPKWYTNLNNSSGQQDFEMLLGRKIEEKTVKKGEYTMQNTIMEMKDDSFVMRMVFKVIENMMAKKFGGKKDYRNPTFRMMVVTAADCTLSGMKITEA